jgi:oligopeptide transport system permease protein
MWKYAIKRVLLAVVTIFIIIAITFFAMNAIPGGPFNKEKATDPRCLRCWKPGYNLDNAGARAVSVYICRICCTATSASR